MEEYSVTSIPVLVYEDSNGNATYRVNGPDMQKIKTVLHQIASGPAENQNALLPQCREAELKCQILSTSRANDRRQATTM